MKKIISFVILFCPFFVQSQINPPNDFPGLFEMVQEQKIFSDQKKFVDCIPLRPVDSIISDFNKTNGSPDFDLKKFVASNFDTVLIDTIAIIRHIELLWDQLTRSNDRLKAVSSLLPLPYPYVVPGGRFREIYYWDSYFTMLGLIESNKTDIVESMIDNFAYLIETYGHIPNGNRTYYLSRSQPPFFALMVELLASEKGDDIYIKYLHALIKEYQFWMDGAAKSLIESSYKRTVNINQTMVLNRYYDGLKTPRPESYIHDVELINNNNLNNKIYRDIRAAAESGWDFSSRWFSDTKNLTTIHTTDIIPVDLNCLLYQLEKTLSKAYTLSGNSEKGETLSLVSEQRKQRINQLFWNEDKGFYFDFDFQKRRQTEVISAAGIYPLFFNIANKTQANLVKQTIESELLFPGGIVTSANNTGQQWDFPNGWPPLQWIAYTGLKNYGYNELASTLANRWLNLNIKVFFETGKMMEKYNVVNTKIPGGGGEYKLQDGFGWTNGVFLKMWREEKIY